MFDLIKQGIDEDDAVFARHIQTGRRQFLLVVDGSVYNTTAQTNLFVCLFVCDEQIAQFEQLCCKLRHLLDTAVGQFVCDEQIMHYRHLSLA